MKKLLILIALTTTTVFATAQEVDLTLFYAPYGSASFETSVGKSQQAPTNVNATASEVFKGRVSMWHFRRFVFIEDLIRQSVSEDMKLHSFRIARRTKRFDPKVSQQVGCRLDLDIEQMIRDAKVGDQYYIYDVKVKCQEGDIHFFPYTAIAQVK